MNLSGSLMTGSLLIVLLAGSSAFAQNATQTTQPNAQAETRVGVNSARRVPLTLRDAITMALEHNHDLEVERINVQLNEFDLRAARGAYDPNLSSNFYYDRRITPVASSLAGGENGRLKTDSLVSTTTLTQKTPWQGGSYQAVFDNNRSTTGNTFNSLNPQYATGLTLTYIQPLWRNRTNDLARRQIRIAKKRLDLSDSQFRQKAIDIISQVQRAYWDLVFARRDREIKRESVELARTQLEHNQRLVEAGTLAPSDVISARVEVERRTDEAEAATDAVQRAENALKAMVLQPNQADQWEAIYEPVEQPEVSASERLPLEDATRLALQNRPEMEQFNLRSEINKADVDYLRDQTKPQIDFVGTYGTVGLAGTERNTVSSFSLLFDRLNELSKLAGLPLIPTGGTTTGVPDILVGGYGQSLSNLFRNDFRAWRFGVNISLPLRNRTALAQLGRSLAEGRQIDVQKQRTVQAIEVEVRNALQAVETAVRRVEAAKNSRINADLQYQSEQRKFDAGQSTNFLVLDRQNALIAARGREVKALTDYTKAVAELQRVLSTTLSSNNIEVKK
ncbi:MAG TPA: TolC family protein [Blastocatellia bacterium]|nr:TolC family protein [Blastocatellia bacterium]